MVQTPCYGKLKNVTNHICRFLVQIKATEEFNNVQHNFPNNFEQTVNKADNKIKQFSNFPYTLYGRTSVKQKLARNTKINGKIVKQINTRNN